MKVKTLYFRSKTFEFKWGVGSTLVFLIIIGLIVYASFLIRLKYADKPQIKAISSLNEIEGYLKDPEKTLIVFDVDYVLIQPSDPCYQFPNFRRHMRLAKKLFGQLTPLQRDLFASLLVFDEAGSSLIESQAPLFIRQLQQKGYKTIGLTATLTGKLQNKDLKNARIDQLKNVAIDFSQIFPSVNHIRMQTLPANMTEYPEFYQGVLFANGENKKVMKGVVLKEFLKAVNLQPEYILVIDDRKNNLEVIAEEFKNSPIMIQGLHYHGNMIFPSKKVTRTLFYAKGSALAKKAIEMSKNYVDIEKK